MWCKQKVWSKINHLVNSKDWTIQWIHVCRLSCFQDVYLQEIMWISIIYLNFVDILSNCEIPSLVWCIFMAHFQCICVQQNFVLMKIKSLLLSRRKLLRKMMFNALKRDTILLRKTFCNFLSADYWKIPLSIEPLEPYFSFHFGWENEKIAKRMPLSLTWNDLLLGHYSNS